MKTLYFVAASFSLLPFRAEAVEIRDSENTDVQILSAWRAGGISLDHKECVGPDPGVGEETVKDCAAQALKLTRAAGYDRFSPSINDWKLPVYNHHGYTSSVYYYGNLVEIVALVKRSVLQSPRFQGIGFYTNNLLQKGNTFIPKKDLHVISYNDEALKATGDAVAKLRFVAWMPGQQGNSGTGWSRDSIAFKPYAEFVAFGVHYRTWEKVAANHVIYRAENGGGVRQTVYFNRQYDLLIR